MNLTIMDKRFFKIRHHTNYDASGDRTLKFQGPYQSMLINGQYWYNFFDVSNYTLYTSPYMVLTNTKNEYTKHYYIEADRVVSKIGGGLLYSIHDIETHVYGFDIGNGQDYDNKNSDIQDMMNRDFICAGISFDAGDNVDVNLDISFWLTEAQGLDEYEENIFFYHKDHLGSSTQISDLNASIIHHIEYMHFDRLNAAPYGENFLEMSNKWQTPYKFNGKEKDEETGMYYYGARYYVPELSIWGSVDPLSDNTPWASAYAYCINNPVRLIDPDGRDWFENELTGAVYYNSKMGKKDAGTGPMTGEGWKHMGKNGMFGRNDKSIISKNSNLLSFYGEFPNYNGSSIPTDYGFEAGFDGDNAKCFMENMGYSQYITQASVYSQSTQTRNINAPGAGSSSISYGEIIRIPEKFSYLLKGNSLNRTNYSNKVLFGFNNNERIGRESYEYSSSNFSAKGVFSVIGSVFGGNHDYRNVRTLSGWGGYNGDKPIINEFRSRYGTK